MPGPAPLRQPSAYSQNRRYYVFPPTNPFFPRQRRPLSRPHHTRGKQASSLNAIRHGLLAKCVVLRTESRAGFDILLDQHIQRYSPPDDAELGVVGGMAVAFWRMRRAWAIETRLHDDAINTREPGDEVDRLAAAFTDLASSPQLTLLHRDEARLHHIRQRAFKNIHILRNTPPPPNEPTFGPGTPAPATPAIPAEPPLPAARVYLAISRGEAPPDEPAVPRNPAPDAPAQGLLPSPGILEQRQSGERARGPSAPTTTNRMHGPEGVPKAMRRKIAVCHRHFWVGLSLGACFRSYRRPHPGWSGDFSAPAAGPFGQDRPHPKRSSPPPSAIPSRNFSQLPPKPPFS